MAEYKITDLTELASGSVAGGDLFAIVDLSADVTKKVSVDSLRAEILKVGSAIGSADADGVLFGDGSSDLATSTRFTYSDAAGLVINPSGTLTGGWNVGLNIQGGAPTFRMSDGANGFGIFKDGDVNYIAETTNTWGSTSVVGAFRNGKFGMGTTNPQQKIHTVGGVRFESLPTSSAGLSAGDLWNDSGTVKIV